MKDICWLCKINFSWVDYEEDKLLDEDGTKPCMECYLESEQEKEVENEFR
jgi:hypothetical protein